MSTTTTVPAAPDSPAAPRLSVEEFLTRYADVPNAELVKGVVKEQPVTTPRHGMICMTIGALIFNHAVTNELGRVMSNDSRVRVGPDSLRGGDVLYFSYERLPKGAVPEGILSIAPDLVVEVRSPSDRWLDVFTKVVEYLAAGVRVVVILDPTTATASVHRADELQRIFDNGDELTLPDVLPGFSIPVARLFA